MIDSGRVYFDGIGEFGNGTCSSNGRGIHLSPHNYSVQYVGIMHALKNYLGSSLMSILIGFPDFPMRSAISYLFRIAFEECSACLDSANYIHYPHHSHDHSNAGSGSESGLYNGTGSPVLCNCKQEL